VKVSGALPEKKVCRDEDVLARSQGMRSNKYFNNVRRSLYV